MGGLDATAFARAAAVVRDRGHVDDRRNLEADCLEGADSGVAAEAGTAELDDDVLEAVRHGVAGGVLSDDLRGVSGGFAGTAEVALAGAGPSDDLTLGVGDRDDRVVEGSEDVDDTGGDVLRALGFANFDRANLFLEEFFSGGLLGDTTDELDWLFSRSGGGWSSSAFSGGSILLGFRSASGLFSGWSGLIFGASGGGCGFFFRSLLGSGFFFGQGDKGLLGGSGWLGHADGATWALAGAGVGAGALTANREALAVANATVAIDRLEALQVAGDFAAEIALNHPLVLGDDVKDLVELFFRERIGALIRIDTGFLDDLVRALRANAVNVTEGDRDFLFRGDFYTEETWHIVSS